MKTATIFLGAMLLAGCFEEPVIQDYRNDQCLRAQLFKECLQSLPAGPNSTGKYNDWDEVVSECADNAYYVSRRLAEQIKPECRA